MRKINFTPTAFVDLAQKEVSSWVNIVGIVSDVDSNSVSASLPKKTITLQSGEFHELLDLLDQKASLDIKLGNVVAVKGCKVEEYRQTRKLSAAHLTYVFVNPPFNGDIVKPEPAQPDSPTKKLQKLVQRSG